MKPLHPVLPALLLPALLLAALLLVASAAGQPDTIAARFKQFGTNGDGKLSPDEQKALPAVLHRRLKGADQDGDGFLTLAEVRVHFGQSAEQPLEPAPAAPADPIREGEITLPGGKAETILDIPHYDFNWQLYYRLAQPRPLPPGTLVKATGWFDNSDNNPANPDPKKTVRWGPQTTDEMMLGYLEYYVPARSTGLRTGSGLRGRLDTTAVGTADSRRRLGETSARRWCEPLTPVVGWSCWSSWVRHRRLTSAARRNILSREHQCARRW